MGLLGDMCVETTAGPIEISKLAECSVENPDFSITAFVWTGGRLFVSDISNIRKIGAEQIFEVQLDDGSVVSASASSTFVMKTGGRKMAPELEPADSLLPLYLERNPNGYPTYRVPGQHAKRKISRLIAEWMTGGPLGKATYVEHIDGNRLNYHTSNLKISIDVDKSKRSYKHKLVRAFEAAQELLDACAAASPKMAKIVGRKKKGNHKVVSVRPGVLADVYTVDVLSMSSLSVSGVFLDLPSC